MKRQYIHGVSRTDPDRRCPADSQPLDRIVEFFRPGKRQIQFFIGKLCLINDDTCGSILRQMHAAIHQIRFRYFHQIHLRFFHEITEMHNGMISAFHLLSGNICFPGNDAAVPRYRIFFNDNRL